MTGRLSSKDALNLGYKFLLPYSTLQWPGYEIGKHHALIAKHLEAVEDGTINRLMVFMPPRSGKTMETAENFIPWYMGRNPKRQVIYATYSHERAGDVGQKVRDNIAAPIHKKIFHRCRLSADSKGKNKFTTTKGGIGVFTGTGGALTGRGAHLFLIDDPIKGQKDAESESAQRHLRDWFKSVAYTRLMDTNAIIVILTRWHHNDLAGWLLREKAHEGWRVLSLPAIADENNDLLGRKYGEALWPEKYPIERLLQTKRTLGSRQWSALYQQKPSSDDGGMVNLDWFGRFDHESKEWVAFYVAKKIGNKKIKPPHGIQRIVQSWDTAFKESQINDPSACTIWGVAKNGFYLLGVINEHLGYPRLRRVVEDTWQQWCFCGMPPVTVLIEDKASGQSLIQDLKESTTIPVIPIKADASKVIRFSECTGMIEAGKVNLPIDAPWLVDYETQLMEFPLGKNDDLVDSTSQFIRWGGKSRRKRSKTPLYWK
jgi:predicted phage terminase large subunit-like protein